MIIGRPARARSVPPPARGADPAAPCRARRTGRALARGLLVGLLLGAVCWTAVGPAGADGAGTKGLALEVTVNTRPGLGALRPGIRTGAAVVKTYRLTNRSGADLYAIRVVDPALPGALIRCPGGRDRVARLTGLRSVRCTATGRARPGTWVGDAVAAGRQPYLRATVRARARSGYAGVGAGLALAQTARVTGPGRAEVRYTVTNTGNRPVHRVRVADPALAPARVVCAGGGPVVAGIAPGATAVCRADVRRAPGTYVGRGRADGTDGLRTLGPGGAAVAPPRLAAQASARFTLPGAQSHTPPPPRSSSAAVPPVGRDRDQAGLLPPGAFDVPPEVLDVPPGDPGLAPGVAAVPPGPVDVPPGAAPVPPAAALLAAVPPPPGIAAPGVVPPGAARPPGARQPQALPEPRPQARPRATPRRPLLSRFVREDHTPTGLGMLTALFLVLLPAAVAAAVLGSRRH
ncbi:hypothetical protein GTY65_09310 [Streptomyces sp. SID8379]|uniref:hypothetical protein n=1 Tax=unclassified Streptomyces TaxID=2593676 RepID=UPI001319F366|nr:MULTISPECIES: hypothetical protein [unclassified Streptomyces]MYW64269.1 hypothetical protein [Streptomyces sp. SID8379]